VSETIPSTRTPCIEFLQQVVLSASRAELTPAISAAEARRRQKHKGKHLNAVAVGQLPVVAARVVRVEEVIVVVLVVLPLREEHANDDRNGEEDAEERGVVDAKRLAGALTTRLVAREGTEVEATADADHALGMSGLGVQHDHGGHRGGRQLRRLHAQAHGGRGGAAGGDARDRRVERGRGGQGERQNEGAHDGFIGVGLL